MGKCVLDGIKIIPHSIHSLIRTFQQSQSYTHSYLLEVLELLVARQALLLVHAPVDGDGGEVLLDEELREGDAPLHALDEDDHLGTDGRTDG